MVKDWRAVNIDLSNMSRKELEKMYKRYAANVNKRVRNIEKSGKFGVTLAKRKNIIEGYLLKSGRVSKATAKLSTQDLKVGIMDLGYFLSLKTTSITGLKKQRAEQKRFFKDNPDFGMPDNELDLFLDFLESETYQELEEEYSSDVIFEEFRNISDVNRYNLSQLEEGFKIWKSDTQKDVNDIIKGMSRI